VSAERATNERVRSVQILVRRTLFSASCIFCFFLRKVIEKHRSGDGRSCGKDGLVGEIYTRDV
jgi:hypothetical protein